MNFDEARAAYPHWGFSIYALEPGAAVTLEIMADDGTLFTFTGPTLASALDAAFPPEPINETPPGNAFD